MEENLAEGIIEQMEKRHEAERTLNELAAGKQKALEKELDETKEALDKTKEVLNEKDKTIEEMKRMIEELKKKK